MKTCDSSLKTLLEGVQKFETTVFPKHRSLFQKLAKGQSPEVLFLTCADSRIDPSMITQSRPGQLFICRNIGNVVPPHGTPDDGVGTVMEYAVGVLGVRHIVICGHSDCGAMKSLLDPTDDAQVPRVTSWLKHAETARRVAEFMTDGASYKDPILLRNATEQNVVAQITNLKTYPEVALRLAKGDLQIHGWYYDIEQGCVRVFLADRGGFYPLQDAIESYGYQLQAPAPGRNSEQLFAQG